MNWIRTDIEIGYRIKCFDLDYEQMKKLSPPFGMGKWDIIKILELLFNKLKSQGYFLKTSALVRVSMPPDKMCIRFWVQDNSFLPITSGKTIESEYISLKKDD